ncbi:serine carboxypeptidase-like clade II [Marchantia polymorpha subsp. ruderalis]|uniref:Carboxypeptidase n=2 Tax=Marchantia polymorpha TaxID=3197 RepID=A0AAF6BWY5_MARPO|nr:hypothetical protein MARPO_0076s0091 [Marchantia polymorpha]BBN16519.1 hypothetical protein Mp_7g07030 [Marchantia polymorpha subsp. ruderalis]|eukprot:PTQ34859.1 hypothetical protein MARPO_0076s0091 [Marchantia polymorpha]
MDSSLRSIVGLSLICLVAIVAADRPLIRQVTNRYRKFNDHLIQELPGAPPVPFAMHSGYVTVDEAAGRALFYWFVEAEVADPTTAPVTLWLNGGPGCSSVGGGALSELGPFYPDKEGKALLTNPYSWNKVSNVIFLESPAGVGFSYTNTSADLITGDERTALDSYEFLVKFFKMYEEFAKAPFYIAGESYAGHYVPQLAATILKLDTDSAINFQGIAVGNAWTDASHDNFGAIFYWWTHALISDTSFYGMVKTCNLSSSGPLREYQQGRLKSSRAELQCDDYIDLSTKEMGDINIYEIYVDVCVGASAQAETKHFAKQLNRLRRGALGALPLKTSANYDPCIDNEVEVYLNRPEVQEALHANVTGLKYRWTDCSDIVDYSYEDLLSSVIPVYTDILLKSKLRILIFSGDTDAIVPVTGSRSWIRTLDLKIVEDWRPYYLNQQVAGYVTKFDNMTFATVRGAGHMVPYTQPERGLYLFGNFISDSAL